MSGRVASQTGYMLACPEPCTLLQVCPVHLYIVMCSAAERIHVPGAGLGRAGLGAWREFGGSSERDNRTNGALLGAMQDTQHAHVDIKRTRVYILYVLTVLTVWCMYHVRGIEEGGGGGGGGGDTVDWTD